VEVKAMPKVALDLTVDEIKAMIFQLPPQDLLMLMEALEERAQTLAMMQLAETGFGEWEEPGEDIYDVRSQGEAR
jgi:hypothetical protein